MHVDLINMVDELEQLAQSYDAEALNAVRETRSALSKAIERMNTLESGFDRIAEKSCALCSRLS